MTNNEIKVIEKTVGSSFYLFLVHIFYLNLLGRVVYEYVNRF